MTLEEVQSAEQLEEVLDSHASKFEKDVKKIGKGKFKSKTKFSSLIEENKQHFKVAVEHEAEQKYVSQLFWVRKASSA